MCGVGDPRSVIPLVIRWGAVVSGSHSGYGVAWLQVCAAGRLVDGSVDLGNPSVRRYVRAGGGGATVMTAPILCSVCASPVTFWANLCGDWTYNRCESCGHVDLEGQPELKELERYYSEVYQNSAESFAWAVEHRYV